MSVSKESLREALDRFYSKETLLILFKKYFLNWIADGYIGSNLGLFEVSLIGQNTKKQTFLDLTYQLYSKEDIFFTLYSSLEPEVKEIFHEIAWNDKYFLNEEEMDDYLEEEIRSYKTVLVPKDKYRFFAYKEDNKWSDVQGNYFYLNTEMIKMIRKALPKPKEYFLNPVKEPETLFKLNSEDEILEKISVYYNFYNMGGIELSSSNKLLKKSKNEMKKYCGINEYYTDKGDLDFLKTETAALFILAVKEEYRTAEFFQAAALKKIFVDFLDGKLLSDENFNYTTKFLNYLKGVKNIWDEKEQTKLVFETLKKVLNDIPLGKVISIDNILKYVVYRDEFIEIMKYQNASDYIYINEADYGRTRIGAQETYYNYITVPLVKSLMAILGTFGILELYYDLPSDKNGLYLKNGYLTKYDGIKYVKLTKLGEYIIGKRKNYDLGEVTEEAEIYLDEDRLIVTILGTAPVKEMFLEQVGSRIASNKFKVDYETFLKNIDNEDDLYNRIKLFKTKISEKPGQIWEDFFTEILSKVNCVSLVEDMQILKLKEDKELIKTVASDDVLKKLIYKAEGFYILVKKDNLKTVMKRLREFGYLNEC